jgi:hypothetical protein
MSNASHLRTQTRSRAQNAQTMICDLQKVAQMLDVAIRDQQDNGWIRDPSRSVFPLAARSLVARRDNLKATIATLSNQFELTQ